LLKRKLTSEVRRQCPQQPGKDSVPYLQIGVKASRGNFPRTSI
jgi:hypothetical protein